MQKAKGNHHKMNKTPEGRPSSADVKNNSEKLPVLGKLGQVATKAAGAVKDIVRTVTNRNGFAERLGINTEKATGVDVDSAAVEGVLSSGSSAGDSEKDSREGSSNGLTPEEVEALKRDARVVVISTPEEQTSDSTEDASGSSAKKNIPVSEPPEPTPDELARIKWNDEMRDAAAKRFVLVHPTTEEDLRELESFGVDIDSSSVSPEEVSRYKDENVIDKEMFRTTIPNVDKPKKDDNPEGLTPYEQAMRDKYLGDEYDDAEKTEDDEAVASLKVARERFAKASIAVESHFFKKFFGGKKRQEELNAATEELKQSELEYMRLKFADKIEAAKQDSEKQAELAAEMGQAAFASMRETSRMTTDKYDSMLDDRGKFKKAAAKVGKWFNKGGKIAQWLKLGGTGFVGGAIVGSVAAWPITTAVGIVTELGVAGATKQAVLEEHRGEDRIAADDRLETIDPSFEKTVANMKIDDVMEHAVNVSVDNLKDVSIERQDDLRKRIGRAMTKYGIGFALGGYAGKYIGDWANSAHATGPEGNADTTPQSGGEQTPQSGGASSADNPATKAIVDNINPDASNFNSYDYPWDWAAEKFGNANAIDQLHNLADKAMANGHTVEWFNNPDGSVWMKVDGSSATADVLKVLNKYA